MRYLCTRRRRRRMAIHPAVSKLAAVALSAAFTAGRNRRSVVPGEPPRRTRSRYPMKASAAVDTMPVKTKNARSGAADGAERFAVEVMVPAVGVPARADAHRESLPSRVRARGSVALGAD